MVTILGAGGPIADELTAALTRQHPEEPIRLVGRKPKAASKDNPGAKNIEPFPADLTNPEDTLKAVAGARIAYLVAGLEYNVDVWRESWPRLMNNVLDACRRHQTRLVFFDNVYMYGPVKGQMTEDTPFRPTSEKGKIRAAIAQSLLEQIRLGNLTAGMIVRAADFYGPGIRNGVLNMLVLDKLAHRQRALWMVNSAVPHSFTYTPDIGPAMVLLADTESAWNQTWHLPTAPDPPSIREFTNRAAALLNAPAKLFTMPRPLLKIAGLFDRQIREINELLYQYDSPYLFDSTKFTKAFHSPHYTPYDDGLRACCRPPATL